MTFSVCFSQKVFVLVHYLWIYKSPPILAGLSFSGSSLKRFLIVFHLALFSKRSQWGVRHYFYLVLIMCPISVTVFLLFIYFFWGVCTVFKIIFPFSLVICNLIVICLSRFFFFFKLRFGGCFLCLETIAFISLNIFLHYSFCLILRLYVCLTFEIFFQGHWIFVHFFPPSVSVWLICIALSLITEIIGVLCLITLSFLILCHINSGHLWVSALQSQSCSID